MERLKIAKQQHVTYGEPAPQHVDLEELCAPHETCAACPVLRCTFTDVAEYLNVQPLRNVNFTGLPPRLAGKVVSIFPRFEYVDGLSNLLLYSILQTA